MIKTIKAKNFLSWKQLEFKIASNIILISGYNYDDNTPEASGKSAIMNALSWALYGKLPKDVKIDEVITFGEKSCEVCIELEHDKYKAIIRSRKPNDLYLLTNDNQIHKGKDLKDTQNMIKNLIGLSFNSFIQSIYFAQNYNKKFIYASQEERGNLLSEIQNLQLFDKARTKTHNSLGELISEKTKLQYELNNITNLINSNTRSLIDIKRQEVDRLSNDSKQTVNRLIKIENLKEQAQLLRDKFCNIDLNSIQDIKKSLEDQIIEYSALINSNKHSESLKHTYNTRISTIKTKMTTLKENANRIMKNIENPNEPCPLCGISAKSKVKIDNLNIQLNELKAKGFAYKKEVIEIKEKLIEIKLIVVDQNKVNELRNKLQKIRNIEDIGVKLKEISKEIKYLSEIKENVFTKSEELYTQYEEKLQDLRNKYIISEEKFKEVSKNENRLQILKKSFKDIKSHIFHSILLELQNKINSYIQDLFESEVKVELVQETMKIDVRVYIDGIIRTIGLLSGGQQRRVSIAFDLALSDIVRDRQNGNINLMIFDEPFQNLSEDSMKKCIQLLTSVNKNVIIIEHNSIAKAAIDDVYWVEYKNGMSQHRI